MAPKRSPGAWHCKLLRGVINYHFLPQGSIPRHLIGSKGSAIGRFAGNCDRNASCYAVFESLMHERTATMDTEQRRHLRIVSRGGKLPQNSRARFPTGQSMPEDGDNRDNWVTRMWREVERVHSLMDQVNSGMLDMLLEQSDDRGPSPTREAELRILQAYYKGLRFAIECHRNYASGK
jgi:hypothetical protein